MKGANYIFDSCPYIVSLNPSFDTLLFLDELLPGDNACRDERIEVSGKGVNVCRTLYSRGVPSLCFALVGSENAEDFARRIQQQGMRAISVLVQGRTRENIYLHTASGMYSIIREGFEVTDRDVEQLCTEIYSRLDAPRTVVLSGKLPRGLDPRCLYPLAQRLHSMGCTLVLDSSSLSLTDISEIEPHLIKPNRQELAALTALPCESLEQVLAAGKKLLAHGAVSALISLDRDGALYLDGSSALLASTPSIEVKSAVGAGDNTLAQFIACRSGAQSLEQSLKMAVAAGTASCLCYGSHPPKAALVAELCEQVQVRPVSW